MKCIIIRWLQVVCFSVSPLHYEAPFRCLTFPQKEISSGVFVEVFSFHQQTADTASQKSSTKNCKGWFFSPSGGILSKLTRGWIRVNKNNDLFPLLFDVSSKKINAKTASEDFFILFPCVFGSNRRENIKAAAVFFKPQSAKPSVFTNDRSASRRHSGRKTNVFIKSPQARIFKEAKLSNCSQLILYQSRVHNRIWVEVLLTL